MPNNPVVLTLPGPWSSRDDFLAALNAHAPHFGYAKGLLTDLHTQDSVQINFRKGRSRNAVTDFWWAGLHWQDTPEMETLRQHKSRITLTHAGGSLDRMKQLMTAASVVVRAGALGVHVGPVGIAHAPHQWLALESESLDGILRAFVITIDAVRSAYSCGMHNFGLKEVSVPSGVPSPSTVVGILTRYLLVKGARIDSGQTVSIGGQANRYRFHELHMASAPDGTIFQHQVGTWQLVCAGNFVH